jgi:hypothetical protein
MVSIWVVSIVSALVLLGILLGIFIELILGNYDYAAYGMIITLVASVPLVAIMDYNVKKQIEKAERKKKPRK